MLLTEWNTETWGEVQREEGREEGRVEGRVEGREEGREQAKKEDARNFLALGVSPATVAKATGLDMETIKGLSVQ
jgi:predicted transposase/invertase (TIGR01784 family)